MLDPARTSRSTVPSPNRFPALLSLYSAPKTSSPAIDSHGPIDREIDGCMCRGLLLMSCSCLFRLVHTPEFLIGPTSTASGPRPYFLLLLALALLNFRCRMSGGSHGAETVHGQVLFETPYGCGPRLERSGLLTLVASTGAWQFERDLMRDRLNEPSRDGSTASKESYVPARDRTPILQDPQV